MNNKEDLICDYLGISSDDKEPDYDNGQWYRLTVCGPGVKDEIIYTEDLSFFNNTPSLADDFISRGYIYYYKSPRTYGAWPANVVSRRHFLFGAIGQY